MHNLINLYTFQDPKSLFNLIDASPTDFVYASKYQKEREARILAVFGIGWQLIENKKCLVRLTNDMEPAEAQININNNNYDIQISMCIEPKRQIGTEYKTNTVYDNARPASLEALYSVIKENVRKKLAKYGTGKKLNLLFYINMDNTAVTPEGLTNAVGEINNLDFEAIWAIFDTCIEKKNGSLESGFAIAKLFPSACKGFFKFSKIGITCKFQPKFTL